MSGGVAGLGGRLWYAPGHAQVIAGAAMDGGGCREGMLRIERNEWQGHICTTKGNRIRYVPMTARLREALRGHRHLRGERVLYRADVRAMTESSPKELVARAARLANLRNNGPHILRHTFCSHLAMRGAVTRAIQELASGHRHDTAVQAPESGGDTECD